MKKQTSFYFVIALAVLAGIGVIGGFISNPTNSLKSILVILIVGVIVYFLFKSFFKADPQKNEHNAFRKAAKKTTKKYQQDVRKASPKTTNKLGNGTKANKPKKKIRTASHLKVIEGKKGKKKNRASF